MVQPGPIAESKGMSGSTIAAIVIVAVAVVAIAVVGVLLLADSPVGSFEPTYRGTVSVTVYNDAWFDSKEYTIYIDGQQVKSDSLGPLSSETWSFTVTWRGGEIHECEINVVHSTGSAETTVYISDGEVESVSLTI